MSLDLILQKNNYDKITIFIVSKVDEVVNGKLVWFL